MKKIMVGVVTLTLIVLLFPLVLIALLQSQYGTAMFNQFAQRAQWPIHAETVDYTFPYHLTLLDVQLFDDDPLYIQEVSIWLNPALYQNDKWQVDSLLLDGINLAEGLPESMPSLPYNQVHLYQLALQNVDIGYQEHSARGLNLQVQQPVWLNDKQLMPYGDLQLSVEQWYWQGEALDNLLLDMTYRPQNSTVYGTSFDWRGANISGQAEQYPTGWSLVNVTIDRLKLNPTKLADLKQKPWQQLLAYVNHINSLDLLRSDVRWHQWHWVNLNLSAEDLTLPLHPFQQRQAKVSFSADSMQDGQQVWVEPRANISLKGRQIQVHDASTQWQQGTLSASGSIYPESLHIEQLSINRVKWAIEAKQELSWLSELPGYQPTWQIDQLDIKHSQIIQLVEQPYWQVTGLNASGEKMIVKQEGAWGLWQGQFEASAANASYDQVLAAQPIITMHSQAGNWQISRFNAPLEQGYIKANGSIDLTPLSRPWSLTFSADGLPNEKLFTPPASLQWRGLSSWSGQISGLGGDDTMLYQSLNGTIQGEFHDAQLRLVAPVNDAAMNGAALDNAATGNAAISNANKDESDGRAESTSPSKPENPTSPERWLDVSISPVSLDIDRGRLSLANVTIEGLDLQGEVSGQVDLAQRSLDTLRYDIRQGCTQWRGHWLDAYNQTYQACPAKAPTPPKAQTLTAENATLKALVLDTLLPKGLQLRPETLQEKEPSQTAPQNVLLTDGVTLEATAPQADAETHSEVEVDEPVKPVKTAQHPALSP